MCGLSAIALNCRAPVVLSQEALEYADPNGASIMGSTSKVKPEKAVVANSNAVREWDSNGTVFGYNAEDQSRQAGEFGHNDFYPVVQAAVEMNKNITGEQYVAALITIDEIRGRLAEVFSLKTYKIDHVVHGAIASAVVYGTLIGLSIDQIESAVGMVVAHYIPYRAIRAGHQISDSKGASAAISTEMAILACHRAQKGFVGPADIFRNPQALFRLNQPTQGDTSPFDITLGTSGSGFSVMDMHFKLGLYEHQSAGALHAILQILMDNHSLLDDFTQVKGMNVTIYEPAYGIICDPAKKTPATRQSADHSLYFIVSSLVKNALEQKDSIKKMTNIDDVWKATILTPQNYSKAYLEDSFINDLMQKINLTYGGKEYDAQYPLGIPTSLQLDTSRGQIDSGMVLFPNGHSKSKCNLVDIMENKFKTLGNLAGLNTEDVLKNYKTYMNAQNLDNTTLKTLYNIPIKKNTGKYFDD